MSLPVSWLEEKRGRACAHRAEALPRDVPRLTASTVKHTGKHYLLLNAMYSTHISFCLLLQLTVNPCPKAVRARRRRRKRICYHILYKAWQCPAEERLGSCLVPM